MASRKNSTVIYPSIVQVRPGENDGRNEDRFRAQSGQQIADILLQLNMLQNTVEDLEKRLRALEGP